MMASKNKIKYIFILAVVIIAAIAFADSFGLFNPKPYTAVSHGSHVHYVPYNHDPNVSIDKFPTVKPEPDEKITPTGQIVPKDSVLPGDEQH